MRKPNLKEGQMWEEADAYFFLFFFFFFFF
jgi:hypothetical protein